MKVGISYVDEAGALKNVQAEAPGWDFDGARGRAARALGAGAVEGAPDGRHARRTGRSSTRRSTTRAWRRSSSRTSTAATGAATARSTEAEGFVNYSIFSLWDTFRAAHPLNTIIDPGRVHDLVASMLAFGDEHGLLPVWLLTGNETNTMTGNHAVPVMVDAVLKGLAGVDPKRALDAVVKSQSSDLRDLDDYRAVGLGPLGSGRRVGDQDAGVRLRRRGGGAPGGVRGRQATARPFRARSEAWRHVYDPATGFMRGRLADGSLGRALRSAALGPPPEHRLHRGQRLAALLVRAPRRGGLVRGHGGDDAFVAPPRRSSSTRTPS